jgi:hypothetical protein
MAAEKRMRQNSELIENNFKTENRVDNSAFIAKLCANLLIYMNVTVFHGYKAE